MSGFIERAQFHTVAQAPVEAKNRLCPVILKNAKDGCVGVCSCFVPGILGAGLGAALGSLVSTVEGGDLSHFAMIGGYIGAWAGGISVCILYCGGGAALSRCFITLRRCCKPLGQQMTRLQHPQAPDALVVAQKNARSADDLKPARPSPIITNNIEAQGPLPGEVQTPCY